MKIPLLLALPLAVLAPSAFSVEAPKDEGAAAFKFGSGLEHSLYLQQDVDWTAAHDHMADFLQKYPGASDGQRVLGMYMYSYEGFHTRAESQAEWNRLAAIPGVADGAKGRGIAKFFATIDKPLDISYTAVDGRKVDLRDLRGKVVVVDFWGTWCPDCKRELPNTIATYGKFHDQGVEFVGVTMERTGATPADAPDAVAAKTAAARQKLIDFTQSHSMPWPQSFDDKGWTNDFQVAYSIQAVPTNFVLDKEGRVVAINAFGARLGQTLAGLVSR